LVGKKLDAACETGYQVIEKKHCEDYRELYEAVTLDLEGDCRNISDIPIDQRLRKRKEEDNDNQLAVVYFQYGRYLLISSSRPGSLPANLQGIWNDEMIPAWDSKFTININTQMNYWPAEICSLSQCHLPLFDHLLRMWERGKETAGGMYGCRGFVAHHNTDIWGDCAPQDIYIPASYWVMGGAWLCTHIWTHYIYTGDMEFLRRMYPILKDSVIFFHDYLIEDHGEMVTCPSVSPENTYILPDGTKGCVCAGSSMDNQILRDLMEGYLKASEALGIQDEDMDKTREILNKIPVTKIGKYGQIMEWREDYEEEEPGHRHISQLYALHPSHQITVDKTPELTRAAANTLERRLSYGGGHTGWSCAWIVNLYARLGEGDKALDNLNKLWRQSTFPNLMDNHPRRDSAVFQIDGNFGATAAIAEMLVQSDEDRVLLLPALPEKWKCGKVTGLTIVGGARLDIQWAEGRLTDCTIRSERTMEILLVYGQEKRKVSVKAGESLTVKGAVV
jgi:alpha-L-fucosidase 2